MSSAGGDAQRPIEVAFSAAVFSLEVVKKAAYRLSGRAAIDIQLREGTIICLISSSGGAPEELANELRVEVLDQDLRKLVAEETAPTRNAILAYALSKTGLQGGGV